MAVSEEYIVKLNKQNIKMIVYINKKIRKITKYLYNFKKLL